MHVVRSAVAFGPPLAVPPPFAIPFIFASRTDYCHMSSSLLPPKKPEILLYMKKLGDPTVYGNMHPCPAITDAVLRALLLSAGDGDGMGPSSSSSSPSSAGYANACGTLAARSAIAKHHRRGCDRRRRGMRRGRERHRRGSRRTGRSGIVVVVIGRW